MEGQIIYRWVRGPDGKWVVAQFGPELFAVRIPGTGILFGPRDFEVGPAIEKPTNT